MTEDSMFLAMPLLGLRDAERKDRGVFIKERTDVSSHWGEETFARLIRAETIRRKPPLFPHPGQRKEGETIPRHSNGVGLIRSRTYENRNENFAYGLKPRMAPGLGDRKGGAKGSPCRAASFGIGGGRTL